MSRFNYKITLEDNFKGINYKLIQSNDPIISLYGGICTFDNTLEMIKKAGDFLKNDDNVEKSRTNNPSLLEECKQIKDTPDKTAIIIIHNDLIKTLSGDEYNAMLYHEIGHIYHKHNQKKERRSC